MGIHLNVHFLLPNLQNFGEEMKYILLDTPQSLTQPQKAMIMSADRPKGGHTVNLHNMYNQKHEVTQSIHVVYHHFTIQMNDDFHFKDSKKRDEETLKWFSCEDLRTLNTVMVH